MNPDTITDVAKEATNVLRNGAGEPIAAIIRDPASKHAVVYGLTELAADDIADLFANVAKAAAASKKA